MVDNMYIDCDADTLLIKANPIGPTCHRGTTACFDTPAAEGFIRSLSALVRRRHAEMPESSYTTRLFIKGIKAITKRWVRSVPRASSRPLMAIANASSTRLAT